MELVAFALIGVVWGLWLLGVFRLARIGRTGLAWSAFILLLVPAVGVGLAVYGLFASPDASLAREWS